MKTAEEHFTEEVHNSIKHFGRILKAYFRTMSDPNLETLLLICMAVFLGADNVYQVLQVLGLPKTATYDRVKNVSVYYWREFMQNHLYSLAIPLLQERLSKSDSTSIRDGLVLAVDDSVIARMGTELGYVWKWLRYQLKRVTNGQDVIALVLVIDDQIIPLDVRIVSKQGKNLKTKPEIYEEMLAIAKARFTAAGIDTSQLSTTGDSAYLSGKIAKFCQGESETANESDTNENSISLPDETSEPDTTTTSTSSLSDQPDPCTLPILTGIFTGKKRYVFEIDGKSQKAKEWCSELEDKLAPGWGTDNQPVYRTKAYSKTFGQVTLVFYIPKGKRAVSYLVVIGTPLRSSEALHTFAFHHRIEEFWKLLKDTFEMGDMQLRGREGAHACVAIKIISYLIVNMMKQNLRKLKSFKNVTINLLVRLCPKFVDMQQILKEHFHDIIPENYTLDKALA